MRRALVVIAVVSGALFSASLAAAKPAQVIRGSVVFADQGVQAQATFDARRAAASDLFTFVDVSGPTTLSFVQDGTTAVVTHDVTFTQPAPYIVGGAGGSPAGGPYAATWHIVSGAFPLPGLIDLTVVYDTGAPGTTMRMIGQLAPDGSMSGTWSDDYLSVDGSTTRTGTWTAPPRALPTPSFSGTGSYEYSNASGDWYVADVHYVYAFGSTGYLGGVIRAAGDPSRIGAGLAVKVTDNGEPGAGRDTIAAALVPSVSVATILGFAGQAGGFGPPVTIGKGNIQVFTR
jgi:hypothetical protein